MKLTYDIFRKLPDGAPIWVEAVSDLELARIRLADLAKREPGDYIIYDLSRCQIIGEQDAEYRSSL